MIIIYANSALPSPSSKCPHKKGHTVRLPVGSRGAELAYGAPGAVT